MGTNEVFASYRQLLAIAARGNRQVFLSCFPGVARKFEGTGLSFIRDTWIDGFDEGDKVGAQITLHVACRDGDLYLETTLRWRCRGDNYGSYTSCLLEASSIGYLAREARVRPARDMMGILWEGRELQGRATRYQAVWEELFPGHDTLPWEDDDPKKDYYDQASDYHGRVVDAAKAREGGLLCLLTLPELNNEIRPEMLAQLLGWLRQQKEAQP
jgi:hypothetical protein